MPIEQLAHRSPQWARHTLIMGALQMRVIRIKVTSIAAPPLHSSIATMKVEHPLALVGHSGLSTNQPIGSAAQGFETGGSPPKPRLNSQQIFAGTDEVEIAHGDMLYRLRITSLGKLILTK